MNITGEMACLLPKSRGEHSTGEPHAAQKAGGRSGPKLRGHPRLPLYLPPGLVSE